MRTSSKNYTNKSAGYPLIWNGLKKNLQDGLTLKQRQSLVDKECREISIKHQCALLGVNRSTLYYKPEPLPPMELLAKEIIDYIYTNKPIFGYRRITKELAEVYGLEFDPKTILKYMREMGIQAIYPKPNLSQANPENKVYPYLLKGLEITHVNQVWSTDITYIPMMASFMYLTVVIDWYSRYVLSWALSDTLEIGFVLDVAKAALQQAKPDIMNSDQGSHYTSPQYTQLFLDAGTLISMDHRGRCFDNIFVERLWRSVKYELVYISEFRTPRELRAAIRDYFKFYNEERYHQSLNYLTPADVYLNKRSPDKKR